MQIFVGPASAHPQTANLTLPIPCTSARAAASVKTSLSCTVNPSQNVLSKTLFCVLSPKNIRPPRLRDEGQGMQQRETMWSGPPTMFYLLPYICPQKIFVAGASVPSFALFVTDPKVHLTTWTVCSKKPHSDLHMWLKSEQSLNTPYSSFLCSQAPRNPLGGSAICPSLPVIQQASMSIRSRTTRNNQPGTTRNQWHCSLLGSSGLVAGVLCWFWAFPSAPLAYLVHPTILQCASPCHACSVDIGRYSTPLVLIPFKSPDPHHPHCLLLQPSLVSSAHLCTSPLDHRTRLRPTCRDCLMRLRLCTRITLSCSRS